MYIKYNMLIPTVGAIRRGGLAVPVLSVASQFCNNFSLKYKLTGSLLLIQF